MAKERYKSCTDCKTIHFIHRSFKDRSPTCFVCGGSSFENSTNSSKTKNCPIYCDWNLQHRVDEAADKIAEYIISKHCEKIDPTLLEDFRHYLVYAANSSRRDFAFSKDGFEKFTSPISRTKDDKRK